jgi:hypothetical protein
MAIKGRYTLLGTKSHVSCRNIDYAVSRSRPEDDNEEGRLATVPSLLVEEYRSSWIR